ncbi:conjugal transfer protein TraN [Leclercia adecarboxylata]|nr:conjugal transfer protein TraN [Leclercia adecarboxylata]KMN63696.1 conjugal transfer protein TraN [Leclercia sp. LK8]
MKTLLLAGLLMVSGLAMANPQYDNGSAYAETVKGKGMDTLKGTSPAAIIPGYTDKPSESQYYGGETATGSADLENAGTGALQNTDAGKTLQDLIKNRPTDPISPDAPFLSNVEDTVSNAGTIMSGTDTGSACQDVNINKNQITNYSCERTPAVELACTRTASITGHYEPSTDIKQIVIQSQDIHFSSSDAGYIGVWTAGLSGRVVSASAEYSWNKHLAFSNSGWFMRVTTPFGLISMDNNSGTIPLSGGMQLTEGQPEVFSIKSRSGSPASDMVWYNENMRYRFSITLSVEVPSQKWVPEVTWTENCPFDKNDQVLMNSACTQPGGDRVVTVDGHQYTVHSDCWEYTDTYLSQEADSGTCGEYMNNPACTVFSTTCMESVNGNCLREQAVFSCETSVSGQAQVCGSQVICTDGSCDNLQNDKSDSFQSAVSGLAALAAAGKDVAALNGVNVSAFTGEGKKCRKAMAGFSNCCKDSGWGNDAGLASCSSDEKALGEAKKRKLTIYVGSYCARKVLGVCLEKKEGYCQFDSKLAKIVQEQGRRGQLGIGFGDGDSPDCRGLTVEELKRLKFDQMNFADFYDDLENGTTLPADQDLLDHIKQQITEQVQESRK